MESDFSINVKNILSHCPLLQLMSIAVRTKSFGRSVLAYYRLFDFPMWKSRIDLPKSWQFLNISIYMYYYIAEYSQQNLYAESVILDGGNHNQHDQVRFIS